jgi:hypothetical protein
MGENPICSVRTAKNHIQSPAGMRCRTQMNKKGYSSRGRRVVDYAAAAAEEMKHYCAIHPGSPSAVRRPQLFFRGDLWIALLGPSVEEGIVGIGPSVSAALRAFDTQYLAGLRPPNERIKSPTRRGQSLRTTESVLAVFFQA